MAATLQNDWQDCTAGELSQMVGRLNTAQKRAHRRQLYGKTAACMLLVACGVFAVGTALDSGDPLFGGISCTECKGHFAAYQGHRTDTTPIHETLVASMATHLQECKPCRDLFEQTYPGILSAERTDLKAMPAFIVASFAPLY